jgi:hypothetical protein
VQLALIEVVGRGLRISDAWWQWPFLMPGTGEVTLVTFKMWPQLWFNGR